MFLVQKHWSGWSGWGRGQGELDVLGRFLHICLSFHSNHIVCIRTHTDTSTCTHIHTCTHTPSAMIVNISMLWTPGERENEWSQPEAPFIKPYLSLQTKHLSIPSPHYSTHTHTHTHTHTRIPRSLSSLYISPAPSPPCTSPPLPLLPAHLPLCCAPFYPLVSDSSPLLTLTSFLSFLVS